MKSKRGYAKRVAEIRKELTEIRRSTHGYAFWKGTCESEEYKNKKLRMKELEAELKTITY